MCIPSFSAGVGLSFLPNFQKGWGVSAKESGTFFEEGGWYPNTHYDDKNILLIFPKMLSEIFCSKICLQNSAKVSGMYQQWTATVLIFLKVPATESLVFFSEYISKTAILTQASVITCK